MSSVFHPDRMFFKRFKGTKNGVLTWKEYSKKEDGSIIETVLFDKVPCRTGATGFLNGGSDDWVRQRGAFPIGDWWLHLQVYRFGVDPSNTPKGIGESWPIGMEFEPLIIKGSKPGQIREEIMLHCDNLNKGTAGCPATNFYRDLHAISLKLLEKKKVGIKKIPIRCFF